MEPWKHCVASIITAKHSNSNSNSNTGKASLRLSVRLRELDLKYGVLCCKKGALAKDRT
jgi:hypothetical protein